MALIGPTYPASAFQSIQGVCGWNNISNIQANDSLYAECGFVSGGLQLSAPDFGSLLLTWGNAARISVLAVLTSGTVRTAIPSGLPTLFTYESDINWMAAADVDGSQFGVSLDVEFPLAGVQFAPATELIANNFQFGFPFPVGTYITHAKVEFQAYSVTSAVGASGSSLGKWVDVNYIRLTLTFGNLPYATGLGTGTGLGTITF